ncbi:MCE family protein [Actinomadura xylanilytica]|uniref:MCE family protein n=1 Tax=Actinomadura xylanilytica TaxID=887459 RepID=UPI00255B00D0|nr:MlaD family protein [Actinomadura xylanilytica]MDL4775584.1 MlaD family protein [Actinomadura xylanilytica]
MLTVATRVRIVAFIVIAVSVLSYLGLKYADLGRLVGMRGYYVVKLDLATTGGLFEGSGVSYRGVTVGKVGQIHLTRDGVLADLYVDDGAPDIPRSLQAVVANRSAVGEQYVDLRPAAMAGPFLAQGDTIPRSVTTTPAPVHETLKSVNDLTASLPLDDLKTVIDELGLAFAGQGPHLQQLLDTSGRFIAASDAAFPATQGLIRNGRVVLRTQNEEAASFRGFARDSRLLAGQLRASDTDLRKIIAAGPGASREVSGLLNDFDPGFGLLLANLTTTARLFEPRQDGLEELLAKLPDVAGMGATVVAGGQLNFGLVNTFFNPQPCTRGYGGTTYRDGEDESKAPAFNTKARCTESPSSGIGVRGSANAPHRGVPTPARPGSAARADVRSALGALGLPPTLTDPEPTSALTGLLGLGGAR